MNQVPGEKLWIGGLFALRGEAQLQAAGVSHVVSVVRPPLTDGATRRLAQFRHLVVPVDDLPTENVLEHFAAADAFISAGLAAGGAVLVHCVMGKSRSATVLAAHLMRKRRLDPDEAVKLIRQARPIAEPNTGFMKQLWLYHGLDCSSALDDAPLYQRWLYDCAVDAARAAGTAPQHLHFRDTERQAAATALVGRSGFEAATAAATAATPTSLVELRCKMCRRTLANSQFYAPHEPKAPAGPGPCAHHFLEPLSWMRPELELRKLEGRLDCPKCCAKVGSYAWYGLRCSCGAWVVPGISIARGRADEVPVRRAAAAINS